jgi:hypothetical protein
MDNTDCINLNEHEYDPRMEYDEGLEFEYLDNDSKNTVSHDDENGGTTAGFNQHENSGIASEKWTRIKLNGQVLMISTMGRMKPYGDIFAASSEGVQYPGTPYRYYPIGDKNYFVHELVWFAFCGAVADGHEIRHKPHYVHTHAHKLYTNRLECITILPSTIATIANSASITKVTF